MSRIIFIIIFNLFSIHLISQQFEVEGSAKIHEMEKKNLVDSVVVWMNDGMLAFRDASSLVEFQILSVSNDTLFLTNGGFVKLNHAGGWIIQSNNTTTNHRVGIGISEPEREFHVTGKSKLDKDVEIWGKLSVIDTTGVPYHGNTIIGHQSGLNITTGGNNTFIGDQTGRDNSTGYSNTFVGFDAGRSNISGRANTFIGWESGSKNQSGEDNTFLGAGAGSMNLTGYDNAFVGGGAGYNNVNGYNNSIIGVEAFSANLSGNFNTANGHQALYKNLTAAGNVAIGAHALWGNITGNNNTAVGYRALYSNTVSGDGGSGNQNVAVGAWSLENADARGNTAVGTESLRTLVSGTNNTGVGEHTLRGISSGADNVAVGYAALINTSGNSSGNVAIGSRAGWDNETGNDNVIIGNNTQSSQTSAMNQIVIGAHATGISDHHAVIGDQNITDVYMSEDAGATVHASVFNVSSDLRLKENIRPLEGNILNDVLRMRPVRFNFKNNPDQHEVGLIAQEILNIFPELVIERHDGIYGIKYEQLTAIFIKALQEQQRTIDQLSEIIQDQGSVISEIELFLKTSFINFNDTKE